MWWFRVEPSLKSEEVHLEIQTEWRSMAVSWAIRANVDSKWSLAYFSCHDWFFIRCSPLPPSTCQNPRFPWSMKSSRFLIPWSVNLKTSSQTTISFLMYERQLFKAVQSSANITQRLMILSCIAWLWVSLSLFLDILLFHPVIVMHPCYKLDYFREHEWEPEWIDRCYEIVWDVWKKHYKPHAAVIVMPEKQVSINLLHGSMILSLLIGKKGNHFMIYFLNCLGRDAMMAMVTLIPLRNTSVAPLARMLTILFTTGLPSWMSATNLERLSRSLGRVHWLKWL